MLIIRSRGTAQEVREFPTAKQRSSGRRGERSTEVDGSDVAPAPLQLLPDYGKERCVGQRGQRKGFLRLANGDDRFAFHVDRSAAIEREVHWIVRMTRFNFDDRFVRDNNRAVGENMWANRRNDEHP